MLTILCGDALEHLRTLPDESVQCCVTSPPYWGLRDYGHAGQLGLEKSPDEYVAKMVSVFREVRRVLKSNGTLWMNLGDSYNGQGARSPSIQVNGDLSYRAGGRAINIRGLKHKDLVGIPWMVAFALRAPFVDWQIKSEAMRAWTAGIVDGEGCITILQTKSSHSESLSFPPVVKVRMSDREALDRLVEVVGSKIGAEQLPPSHVAANQRSSWQWKIVSDQAARIIAEIYPFLTIKRKQAVVAWNHQQFRANRGNQERKPGDLEKEQFCKTLINSLNQRESVDIPSWMKEPSIAIEPGWYLRQDCIWSKPNPMPESVTDRCTKAHEYLFLLTKSARYYYDAESIAEPLAYGSVERLSQDGLENQNGSERVPGKTNGAMKASYKGSSFDQGKTGEMKRTRGYTKPYTSESSKNFDGTGAQDASATKSRIVDRILAGEIVNRNKRSVWSVATHPFKEAHFATFPSDLIKPCILAGSKPGDVILDPFAGSGTTGMVALELGRKALLIELNPEYVKLIEKRCDLTLGLALA